MCAQFLKFLFFCVLVVSCGKNPQLQSYVLENQSKISVPKDFQIIKMNGEVGWNFSTSEKLYKNLSIPELGSMFVTEIDQESLDTLSCSNFNQLNFHEKKLFYLVFLASIAERESDFNPKAVTNNNIGLLQIDLKSAIRHAETFADNVKSSRDLMDSDENLRIGTFILNNQLQGRWIPSVKGKLLTKRNYYWEVLNEEYEERVISSFLNNLSNLPFCHKAD